MKHKAKSVLCLTMALICLLSMGVYAYADDTDEATVQEESYYEEEVEVVEESEPEPEEVSDLEAATEESENVEPEADPVEEVTGGIELQSLTPEGNMTLVDDLSGESTNNKQFITVVTKSGHYFYIIIDQAEDGENTVYFLNQVDEADLMEIMGDEVQTETPAVCTCSNQCIVGQVNTSCQVCASDLTQCIGREKVVEAVQEEEPEQSSNIGAALALLLMLALAGGAAFYFLVVKHKQAAKVPDILDDYDLEDEEDYLNEDKEQ